MKLGLLPKTGFQDFVDQSILMTPTTSVGTPLAGTFYSSISNRASIPDLSADLKVQMGIDRFVTQQVLQLQNEFGPNGEVVWAILNDDKNMVRCVGNWTQASISAGHGAFIQGNSTGDYIEITFYGTGINLMTYPNSSAGTDIRASVDGGAEGANLFVQQAALLQGRSFAPNIVIPVVSGLSLGVHTVRIRLAAAANSLNVFGFQTLVESSNLQINSGSAYINGAVRNNSAQSSSYNSGFESGSLAARGGRVVVYQKSDGTIAKAAQPVDTAQANLAAASHGNEEISRIYHWREFGTNRSDDFTTIGNTGSPSNRVGTLDDGTTSLIAQNSGCYSTLGSQLLTPITAGSDFITFTFVGTGLDAVMQNDGVGTSSVWTVSVDGTSIGTIQGPGNTVKYRQRIVSGLPYGTHTVRFFHTTLNTMRLYIEQLITYQPKKPSIPTGAIELADYNVMATFVGNASTFGGYDLQVSTGVLRKQNSREYLYAGSGWTFNGLLVAGGATYDLRTSTNGDYYEYSFFGTGVELRNSYSTTQNSLTIQIDGAAYTGAAIAKSSGGSTWTPGTSTWLISGSTGAALEITGLSLGLHKVRITKASATDIMIPVNIDVITPIHSHKLNSYSEYQNTLAIGSCTISDNRKTSPVKESKSLVKASAKAVGATSTPSTTSTFYIPCPDLSTTIQSVNGGKLKIGGYVNWRNSTTNGYGFFAVFVNGIQISFDAGAQTYIATADMMTWFSETVIVPPGIHKVDIYWRTSGGSLSAQSISRVLTVEEI